ncbi:MAG: GIY-YIG nuclease family protein [Candidatus Parvarchaeum sp.]
MVENIQKKRFTKENRKRVQSGPGVYYLYAKNAKKPTYIGSTNNLNRRVSEHAGQKFHSFKVEHTESTRKARALEKKLIKKKNPRRNKVYA